MNVQNYLNQNFRFTRTLVYGQSSDAREEGRRTETLWYTSRGKELWYIPAIAEQELEAVRMVRLNCLTDIDKPVIKFNLNRR